MGQHLSESAIDMRIARWVAALGLIAAMAALALPTGSVYMPEIASVLLVGALALFAGHAWGLLIVALADALLLGKVWPLLVLDHSAGITLAAAATALVGSLPGLLLLSRTLPRTVEIVLGSPDSRWRNHGVWGTSAMVAVWLVLPVF